MASIDSMEFWRGRWGDEYTERNAYSERSVASRERLFRRILRSTGLPAGSAVLEIGANLGMNLTALSRVGRFWLLGVDVNERALGKAVARAEVRQCMRACVARGEELPIRPSSMDVVFTCGVLIHVPPARLLNFCREVVRVSRRYVACIEYFSATPRELEYRGQSGLLFTRDFGSFYLDHFPELRAVDYGFFWKRQEFDDVTWWLFEKGSRSS